MDEGTRIRLGELQAWPALRMRVTATVLAVLATSTSSSTISGSEPPSSRTLFLRFWAAVVATALPAPSLPVRDTPRTRGSAMRSVIWSVLTKRLM